MKTDYHRYNLKRKVLQIPPVSLQEFELKQKSVQKAVVEPVPEKTRKIDQLSFKMRLMKCQSEEEIGDLINSLKTTATVKLEECLFCHHESSDLKSNIKHMSDKHSFILYDTEHLKTEEFMTEQLQKVTVFNSCLFCQKVFYSTESAKAHMVFSINKVSKSHCKLDDDEDLSEFYEYDDWVDAEDDEEVHDSETDSVEEVEEDDDEGKAAYITDDETRLVLPSGIAIGNRLFKRYWRQNIKPDVIIPGSSRDANMLIEGGSRAMTFMGATGHQAIIKRQAYKITTRDVKKRMVRDQDFKARVGMKHNNLQHHYREQNPF